MTCANRSEIAQLFAVSPTTIDAWIRRGCPIEARGGHGRSHVFSIPKVVAWRISEVADQNEPSGDVISFDEARTRKMIAEAEAAERDLARLRSDFVEIDLAAEVLERHLESVRQQLLNLPSKLAPILARAGTAKACRDVASREVDTILAALSTGDELAAKANSRAREAERRKSARGRTADRPTTGA